MWGLFGFAGFFVILGVLIERAGVGVAFLVAGAGALAIQALSLRVAVERRMGALRTP